MRRRAFGLAPHTSKLSRPFGVNPSRLRTCGAARSACLSCSEVCPLPQWQCTDYAPACCGRLCESVPSPTLAVQRNHVTKDGSPTRRPATPMELPHHAASTSQPAMAGGVLACHWRTGLARIRAQAGEVITRDAGLAMSPFGSGRPVRPWFVVNPGGGTAAPRASWLQPSSRNNFPAATRLPRGTNYFCFQALHAVPTAARCSQPAPVGRITTRTHWRDLVQPERRKHHG